MGFRNLLLSGLILALPVLAPALEAEATGQPAPPAPTSGASRSPAQAASLPGERAAAAVSATTGMAISPLLGVSAVGAWRYFQTPAAMRSNLPWNTSPWFWTPALLLVLLLALKEPVLYFVPGAKKPLDLLEVLENKASALVAAPVVLQMAIDAFRTAAPAPGHPVAVVTAGWSPGAWFGVAAGGVGLLVLFGIVWLVAHSINILILLSPSATLDILLRTGRSVVLTVVGVSAFLNPWLGLAVSLLVVLLAVRCFGWSWRLTFYGTTVAVDWLGFRSLSALDAENGIRAFAARSWPGLPVRSRGLLRIGPTGEPEFRARALPWTPLRVLPLAAAGAVFQRSFPGVNLRVLMEERSLKAVVLPPRFRGKEEALGQAFGLDFDSENPLSRTLRAAWTWLRETLSSSGTLTLEAGSVSDSPVPPPGAS